MPLVYTRMRSTRVSFKINRVLTVQFVECMFYCNVMDRTMTMRAGRVIWTGCCSCTLLNDLSTQMPRHLANLCHSFYGIEAINIAVFYPLYHILGVRLEDADRLQRVDFKGNLQD